MTLIGLILVLLIVGVVLAIWPIDAEIKRILIIVIAVVVTVVLVLWLVRVLGIPDLRLP